MSEKTFIEEQRAQRGMFRGHGHGNDADRLLEISPTNRNINAFQGKALITVRLLGEVLGSDFLKTELPGAVELAQLCINKDSRVDFMKVAIEQWQGKLANVKQKTVEALGAML